MQTSFFIQTAEGHVRANLQSMQVYEMIHVF